MSDIEAEAVSETTWTTTREAKFFANRLSDYGWRVIAIPDEVLDQEDFVHALRDAGVPFDPAVVYGLSWDATRDSLRGGLAYLPGVRIAFVWPDPTNMQTHSPRDYEIATGLLNELPGFAQWSGDGDKPAAVRVVIGVIDVPKSAGTSHDIHGR